ncbi:MAG: polyphosphate kinase 1 [Planctomycetaceae bacterium]|nr:polyphosphate kinase 1 [Planctomycetaceae bacterium]
MQPADSTPDEPIPEVRRSPAADSAGGAPSAPEPAPPPLDAPELYVNRELSLLEFNQRVLEQAKDDSVPLLERLRYLTICTTNLDEFFEIRVSGLKQQVQLGVDRPNGPDGMSSRELLARIAERAHSLVDEQYRVLNDTLLPLLAAEGVHLLPRDELNERQMTWVRSYFRREVQPVLTPVAIDPAHPFPRVLNKSLNFLVPLVGRDAFGRTNGIAVVNVPRSLPRLIPLPRHVGRGAHTFVMLSSVIHAAIGELFPGLEVNGCYQFRVTRNSDLWVEEEEVDDLLRALEGELPSRNYGDAVRLEVAHNCPPDMVKFLATEFRLGPQDLYQVQGPVNLHRLSAIAREVDRADLKFKPFVPGLPRRLEYGEDMFAALRRGDVLVHHPYQSFAPVVDFLRQAASDRDVLAIKQTLYRTGEESAIADALIAAARAGKEVTVVVELFARFDERANIDLATRMQRAGVNVVYGIVGYKTHAKLMLIVRREGKRLRRYVHVGTGNYHSATARLYTDFGLFTCDADIGEDVHQIFLQLTGMGRVRKLKKMLQAPFTLASTLLSLVDDEIAEAKAGRPARIVLKANAVTEPAMIAKLYQASRAGVKVDLIVRGACSLRPGVPGTSENISVRSIIGRFLEHHRVYRFHAAGKDLVYLASADLMARNFYRRVESAIPVEDPDLKARVIAEGLEGVLEDNQQAWVLQSDGTYKRQRPGRAKPRAVQELLLGKLAATNRDKYAADAAHRARFGFEVAPPPPSSPSLEDHQQAQELGEA